MPPRNSSPIGRFLKALGPGFITGAADDDPSGIATYSQTGAQFGYSQSWTALFSLPFMVAIQEMCGRIGIATGEGLSTIVRKHYARPVLFVAVAILFIANTLNIGADLGAMAASLNLIVPIPAGVLLVAIALATLLLEIFVSYPRYAKFLKWLTLSLFAYVAVAFIAVSDWGVVARSALVPHIVLSKQYLLNIAALLGTTISPYLFFWQVDEEIEEEQERSAVSAPNTLPNAISRMRFDTAIGMIFSNLIAFFVIITVAATLSANGVHDISTAADAALALKPIAGRFAFLLFAIGIIGTGLLAVPILAGSAGYAVSEAAGWTTGLSKQWRDARGFYAVIACATLVGLAVNFFAISPMKMLYYSAIANGLLAPPLMVLILLIANNRAILGERTNGILSNAFGWGITAVMGAVAVALLALL